MANPGDDPRSVSLCVADDATFWPWLSWPRFEAMADKRSRIVVAPIAGLADWGLGHPLDAEETVLMNVLKGASELSAPDRKPLVLPPLRFVFGADPSCAFAVDPPAAHALLSDVAASVAAAGFSKLVLLNASPWNEELCAAAARDLRVSRGLHLFMVHLSALDLDFHPQRSRSRRKLQTLLTSLHGRVPEEAPAGSPGGPAPWGSEPVHPLPGPAATLEEARAEGPATLSAASARLSKLLSDIHDRPPLVARFATP